MSNDLGRRQPNEVKGGNKSAVIEWRSKHSGAAQLNSATMSYGIFSYGPIGF